MFGSMSRLLALAAASTAFLNVAVAGQDRIAVKEARLVRGLVDARTRVPGGPVSPPAESVFLWVRLEIATAVKLPMDIELLKAEAADTSGQSFKIIGLSPYNDAEPVVRFIWEPVSRGGSQVSDVTDLVTTHGAGDFPSFELNKRGPIEKQSAKLTIKKTPAIFSLFFVVPAKAGLFQVKGLSPTPLTTGRLVLPGG